MDWAEYLNALYFWALERSYHVEFVDGGDNCICHITKIIEIDSALPIEKQVYCLLHECGHAMIFDNGSIQGFSKIREKDFNKKSNAFKVYTVLEEGEAWKRGRGLAKRLLIPINDERWEQQMIGSLKKYIDWASN